MTRNWRPKKDPWLPPDTDDQVVYAARAFKRGEATESQQKLIWDWLAYVGGVGDEWQDLTFRPGPSGDRDTTFAAGKQFPILMLRKLLTRFYDPKAPTEVSGSDNPLQPFTPAPYRRRQGARAK